MRAENSFIPVRGVGEVTERTIWREGITHWDAFDGSAVGETTARRIHDFIDDARDRLAARDARSLFEAFPGGSRWRLYENFADRACFFDIETTGLSPGAHDVTVVTCHTAGETTTLVRGDDLTRDALVAAFDGADVLVSFNGKRFDVPFLERAFDVDLDRPHLDLMYPCRQLDLTGGLKRIEADVGLTRDRPDLSGEDAVRLWRAHEGGADGALETLVAYNRDDAENLRELAEIVTDRLHDRVFATATRA